MSRGTAEPPGWLEPAILWGIAGLLLLVGGVVGYALGARAWGPL